MTITQWILAYGSDFIQTVADQEGFLTKQDCQCLYKYIQAFFIQGDVEKRNELLHQCHMILDNLERDLEKLSTDGEALVFSQDEFK